MEDLQLNDNIISFNDRFRIKIDEIEKSINKNDKRYYEIYTNEISNNPDSVSLVEIIYMDSYVLLNYKKRTNLITKEEENTYNDLIRVFSTDKASLYISFFTNENIRRKIINEASKFREQNKLSKSKIYNLLEEVDKGLLSENEYNIEVELKKYDLNIKDLITYIHTCTNTHNLVLQVFDYLNFLLVNDISKYNQFVNYIRKNNDNLFDNINDRININEISLFVSSLSRKKDEPKILYINKTIGD